MNQVLDSTELVTWTHKSAARMTARGYLVARSLNFLSHSPSGYFPANGGFAIQSFTVALVPEPTGKFLGLFGIGLTFALRRSRRAH